MFSFEVTCRTYAIVGGIGGMYCTRGGRCRARMEEGGLLSGGGRKVGLACIRAFLPRRLKELKAWILNIHSDGEKADKEPER